MLWQIAEQYNLRPETVLWANDIQDPDLLLIGQDLLIPPTDGVLYTVRAGDRLADVANRYGVDLQALVNANHVESADQIQAGVDIFLPGGRPLSATATADAAQAAEASRQPRRPARPSCCPTTSTPCSAPAGSARDAPPTCTRPLARAARPSTNCPAASSWSGSAASCAGVSRCATRATVERGRP